MKLNFEIFQLAGAAIGHSRARQSVIAQNVANADTPDYLARDIQSFDRIHAQITQDSMAMRTTRPEHIGAASEPPDYTSFETTPYGAKSPNGNSVSLEDQMFRSAQVKSRHELAVGIYQKSLSILRTAVARQ